MLDPQALVIYERVVREGSFTAAAKALGLGKSTVSERITRLESDLGVRLLQRTTRSLRPTEDGAAFYERCQRVVAELRDAESALFRSGEPRGRLRVTCPRLFAYAFLGPVIQQMLQRYPQVDVDLVLAERSVDLVEEGFDLALRIGRLPDSSLVVRKLGAAPMIYAASPAYLDDRGRPEVPGDLDRHDLIVVGREGPVQWPFPSGPRPVTGRVAVNSLVVARDLAMSGVGIAFLPAFQCAEALTRGLLEPVLTDQILPPMPVNALYPSNRHLSPRVRAFLDLLIEHTRAHPPWEPPV